MDSVTITGLKLNVTTIAGATTLDSEDLIVLCNAAGGAFTVTLPAAASNGDRVYWIKKIDSSANAVTIDPNGGEEIEGDTDLDLSLYGESVTIACDATQWWII